jgi:FkbM family methyltransferase
MNSQTFAPPIKSASSRRLGSLLLALAKHAYLFLGPPLERIANFSIRCFRVFDNRIFRRALFEASSTRNAVLLANTGDNKFLVFTSDKVISRETYARGNFDFDKVRRAVGLLERQSPLETIFDVGANIGTICIPAIGKGYARHAVAFEPDPNNYRLLVANIFLNDLQSKISHHNLALGAKDGQTLEFELSPDNSGDHRIRVSTEEGIHRESARRIISVNSMTFDSAIRGASLSDSLIWMDTQGYEGCILAGASRAISARVPLVIEFWPYGMRRAGSYELLRQSILAYRFFYDLSKESPQRLPVAKIDELYLQLSGGDAAADLLLQA